MGTFIDLTGRRFGRLLLTGRGANRGRRVTWNFVCDCGVTGNTVASYVTTGRQVSCGCYHKEVVASLGRATATHGATRGGVQTPTYSSWSAMRERVLCDTHHAYARYGGKGIEICDRWLEGEDGLTGYECFLVDMGERPQGHSIDRIDTHGHYEPGNCRWTTADIQARNAADTKMSGIDVGILLSMVANDNASLSTLSARFGISKQHAWRIKTGKRWAA